MPIGSSTLVIGTDPDDPRFQAADLTDLAADSNNTNVSSWKTGISASGKSNQQTRAAAILDISEIPAGSTIISAEIAMRAVTEPTDFSGAAESQWGIVPSFIVDEVTWNSRSNGVPWTTSGGDFDAGLLSASIVMPINEQGTDTADVALQRAAALQTHNITDLLQHAFDNVNGIAYLLHRVTPGSTVNHVGRYQGPQLNAAGGDLTLEANLPIVTIEHIPVGTGAPSITGIVITGSGAGQRAIITFDRRVRISGAQGILSFTSNGGAKTHSFTAFGLTFTVPSVAGSDQLFSEEGEFSFALTPNLNHQNIESDDIIDDFAIPSLHIAETLDRGNAMANVSAFPEGDEVGIINNAGLGVSGGRSRLRSRQR